MPASQRQPMSTARLEGVPFPRLAGRRRRRSPGALAAMAAAALLAVGCGDGGDDGDKARDRRRQEEVAERGAEVMPFDLEATTHHFEPTADGLVQTVVADDPSDHDQARLIQDHLTLESVRFESGDYSDPAGIHGESMPGLRELEAGAEDVVVAYEALESGARLIFVTEEPELVDALHRWGEAQVADHGRHAEGPLRS